MLRSLSATIDALHRSSTPAPAPLRQPSRATNTAPDNTVQTQGSSAGLSAAATTPWYFTGKGVLSILLLNIVLAPFLERSSGGRLFESVLITLVLGAGVLAVGGNRRTLLTAVALALPAIVTRWLHHAIPGLAPPELFLGFSVLAIGYVVWHFLRFISLTKRVDSGVLCTGIAAFFMLALLWAFLYQLIDREIPGSFACSVASDPPREMRGIFAFYFSLVTLSTVGFGDITPTNDVARVCAMLEGATGVFFIALLISRLVSMYSTQQKPDPDDAPPPRPPTP